MGKSLRKQHVQRFSLVRNLVCPSDKRTTVTRMSMEVRVAKIKKRKLCSEWSQEAGRGRSHLPHSSSIVDPTPGASCRGQHSTIPAGGRKVSSSPGNSPANERQPQLSQ